MTLNLANVYFCAVLNEFSINHLLTFQILKIVYLLLQNAFGLIDKVLHEKLI